MSSAIDQGKLYPPGFNNANPPQDPQFALVAGGGSSVASAIGQAGGEVVVDTLGGISMTTQATSFITLDSFNNIAIDTTTASGTATIEIIGQSTITVQATDGLVVVESVANDSFLSLGLDVELQSRGALLGGGDVNVTNAGTIAFDTLGAGAITGVQFINGVVYPPPGAGAGTSITQAGAIVATLGGGGVLISSIGVGADVEVYNAGTIRFDAMGAGAITGLSTINSAAYFPYPGSLSSISGGGATIEASSTIALQAFGNSFLTLNSVGALVSDRVTLSAGTAKPAVVLNDGGNNVAINNPSSATPSYLTMDATGVVEVSGAAVNVVNLSTVNGVPFVNGGTVSQDLTVSTLTAGVRLSTLALDVSSISGVAWPVPGYVLPSAVSVSSLSALDYVSTNAIYGVSTMSNATAMDIYTNILNMTGDVSFSLTDGNGGGISGVGNDVFLTGISTLSGTNLNVSATSVNVVGGTNVSIVGGADVSLLDVGGAGFSVIGGVVQVNGDVGISSIMGLSSINGTSYNNQTVSSLTAFDFVSTLALGGISSINGVEYPVDNPTRQATYYKSVAQTLNNGDTDITFDLSGAWSNADGYITHTDGTTDFTVATAGLYQLEFNATILANGATWNTATNKQIVIDITRLTSQAVIGQSGVMSSGNSYLQAVSGTYYLEVGDVLNLRVTCSTLTGTPTASGITNTFDLNTFFSWRYIP